ncbi:hypothetical protein D3C76_1379020 [compost metagenome]
MKRKSYQKPGSGTDGEAYQHKPQRSHRMLPEAGRAARSLSDDIGGAGEDPLFNLKNGGCRLPNGQKQDDRH